MVKIASCIKNENKLMNCHQESLSEIQKAKSRTCFVDFDIDDKSLLYKILPDLRRFFNNGGYHVLETRGGYHILVEPNKVKKEFSNIWYNQLSNYADQSGDGLIPVPGCFQGGFTPHFLEENIELNLNEG